jgi:hypothetical protein
MEIIIINETKKKWRRIKNKDRYEIIEERKQELFIKQMKIEKKKDLKYKERNKETCIKEKTSNGGKGIRTANKMELRKESGQEYKQRTNTGRRTTK